MNEIPRFIEELFADGKYDFGGEETGPAWTMSAAGDICFILGVGERIAQGNLDAMFEGVADLVRADIAFGNLETPLTESEDRDPVKGAGIKGKPSHLDVILPLGFNMFCIANNHIADYGRRGMEDTIALLEKKNVNFCGAGNNLAEARRPAVIETHGVKVGFLAYCQPEANAAGETEPGVAPLRTGLILEDLARLRGKVDVLVLSLHEGFEFSRVPRLEFKRKCRRFAEEGADVILGHHPHVPHGVELYNDCLIFHSLGNFMFDMHYGHENEWTRTSFVARIAFNGKRIRSVELHPVALTLNSPDGRPDNEVAVLSGARRKHVLDHLKAVSLEALDDEKIEQINGPFISRICLGFMRRCYKLGEKGNEAEFKHFIESVIYRDPYLKAMKDFVKYQLGEESIADF